jgi:hypothetical protein
MYLFYASAFLELILDSVVIKIFIYNLYTFISRYMLWYLDDSVVYMRDLILAHIWLLDLCSYKSGVTSSLGAPPPAPVRCRLTASAPLSPNTGHPRDCRELLNLFPHFPLAAGEPPHRNLVATDRHPCVARPRTQLQGYKTFQGTFCGKSELVLLCSRSLALQLWL